MCGITGYIDFTSETEPSVLDRMVDTLSHRGPDDRGTSVTEIGNVTVGLGHRRLSILDLSSAGHQPMTYQNLEIIYNGEVYNFLEIRDSLISLGHTFETETDTEVILRAYYVWGAKCVDQFIGMFVFAILDKQAEKLIIFRDRAGVKPLYIYKSANLILFGSELKSFHEHSGFVKQIDTDALKLYFDFFYIPAPYTIFKNTTKLEAGHYTELDLVEKKWSITEYWNVKDWYEKPKLELSYEEAKDKLEILLHSAFSYRMVSDVPVGIFLSGGYDSTAVAAMLQSKSKQQLKTFTIGFEEGNNEAPYAKETAQHIGSEHHEYYCTVKEAQDIIPDLPYYYDEPFADSSAIPTILVSRFANQHVTVALSADGGDELFAGYERYTDLLDKNTKLDLVPALLKPISAKALNLSSRFIPTRKIKLKHQLHGASRSLNRIKSKQIIGVYKESHLLPKAYREKLFNFKTINLKTPFDKDFSKFEGNLDSSLAVDYQMYMQDDILTKVDRATMSVSLEGREPLIDHRLLEFSARLPLSYKINNGSKKHILKDIVHKYVPESMLNRPKSGFSLPIYTWLRGDLNYLIQKHLSEDALQAHGLFNVEFVLDLVSEFNKNKLHYSPLIWKLLMFQMWYEKWMKK